MSQSLWYDLTNGLRDGADCIGTKRERLLGVPPLYISWAKQGCHSPGYRLALRTFFDCLRALSATAAPTMLIATKKKKMIPAVLM